MMRKLSTTSLMAILTLIIALAIAGCGGSRSSSNSGSSSGNSHTIYVAATVNGKATYWENGTSVSLTDGTHTTQAKSIFVQ